MGKRSNQRKNAVLYDSDDDGDSVGSSSTAMSELTVAPDTTKETVGGNNDLDDCLDALYEKRGATREKALTTIVDGFRTKLQHEFVANKSITLLHQCLNSVKRGSTKEINFATLAIGLLAITVGCEEGASHEILEESISPLTQSLKSGSESLKISSILDCLAVITFIGGISPEETERSMQIMWQFVNPKLGSNVVAKKPTPAVLTAAISAWTFLLTTMEGCKINSKDWQESISYFSSLLDKDDRSVRIAAGEAIAVIFEIGCLEKFHKEAKGSSEGNKSAEGYIHIQGLRGKILNQVKDLATEAGGKGSAKKDLNSQRNLFRDVLEFLEDGYSPETSVKIGADLLNTSTWSQLIQLNFLKRFLAGGFAKHMQENEVLHDVFGFIPKKKNLTKSEPHLSEFEKRMYKSPNSFLNKSRTQLLNKQRMMSQGRNAGHYSVGAGDEE
ncbi:Interferon-related developmental regulator [Macleaya cordata]|uniref:Interferon-related developmental regulator n=1 Tax=Macleaya cordata TaxID=56857 RepID=A0A200QG19_MACCD|nr:Interferon-related developmental regulator [Macleaya cordata]